jgi:hypothetical protein
MVGQQVSSQLEVDHGGKFLVVQVPSHTWPWMLNLYFAILETSCFGSLEFPTLTSFDSLAYPGL